MFIKIPVYFEINGQMPIDLGPLQLNLQEFVEKSLIPRGTKLSISFTLKEAKELGFPEPKSVEAFLIRRKTVLGFMK